MASLSCPRATHSAFKCSSTERFRLLKWQLRIEADYITGGEAEVEAAGQEEEAEAIPSSLVVVAGDAVGTGEVDPVDQTSHSNRQVPLMKAIMLMLNSIPEPKMIKE